MEFHPDHQMPTAFRAKIAGGGVGDSGAGLCQSQKRSAEPCRSPGRQSRIRSCEPCTRHHSKRNLDKRIGLPGEQSGDCGSVWHSAPACPISRSVETKCGLRAGRVACRRRPVRNCLINRRSAPQFSGCKSATNCSQSGSRFYDCLLAENWRHCDSACQPCLPWDGCRGRKAAQPPPSLPSFAQLMKMPQVLLDLQGKSSGRLAPLPSPT